MTEALNESNEQEGLEEDTQHGRFLTFAIGHEFFGVSIEYVKEIIGIQPIIEVPEVPNYVKGIINLRGSIIPVIDVRLKFKKDFLDYNDRTCIIVIEIKNILVGLIVDNVSDVLKISDDNIVPPPDIKTGFHNKYIKGIGMVNKEVKLLLDCEKILDEDELEQMENGKWKTENK
ncbi:MAG TPA: chemotaxis protein CheW [Clostridiales bacterium]|nr:MAG: chemotaxis protein CheW [Clostridiales bacterium GWD2_32_59]HAN10277.1 chemotaxis protein CheW [Clostridiales bacterium]